jgi:FMN phosphatase YigB (HAD superfamily)
LADGQISAIILDADGVTVLSPGPFSHYYARSIGQDPALFEPFFRGPFQEALTGRADLEQLIHDHSDLWQLQKPFTELMSDWCRLEDRPNIPLISLVRPIRTAGVPVYLSTDQEKNRLAYLRSVMFKGVFDDIIASCEVGFIKRTPGYWQAAITRVRQLSPKIQPLEIAYLDDDAAKVAAAAEAGLTSYVYTGLDQVRSLTRGSAGASVI